MQRHTVVLEFYAGIKLCVLVNFEPLKELCDIYLCVFIQYYSYTRLSTRKGGIRAKRDSVAL